MDKGYEMQLTKEDLKNYLKNNFQWNWVSDNLVSATCKWPAKIFQCNGNVEQNIVISQTYSIGDYKELSWEFIVTNNGRYIDLVFHVLQLKEGNNFSFKVSILQNNLEDFLIQDFSEIITEKGLKQIRLTVNRTRQYLREDSITLVFLVHIVAEIKNQHPIVQEKNKTETIPKELQDFEKLLLHHIFPDVTLIVADQKLMAHKSILAARSPIFYEIFSSKTDTSKMIDYEIKDATYDSIREMLYFMYTGQIHELDEDLAKELLILINKYSVLSLMSKCENFLCKFLTIDNAVTLLKLSSTTNANTLKIECINLIVSNMDKIQEADLSSLPSDLLSRILIGVSKKLWKLEKNND